MRDVLNDPAVMALMEAAKQQNRIRDAYIEPAILRAIEERGKISEAIRINHPLFSDEVRSRLLAQVETANGAVGASIYSALQEANRSSLKLIEELGKRYPVAVHTESAYERFAKITENIQTDFRRSLGYSHLARITEISALAQSSLAAVQFDDVAKAIAVGAHAKALFTERFASLSISYKGLFDSFAESHKAFLALPPVLTELPAVEVFNGADLLRITTHDGQDEEFKEEKEATREQIRGETGEALEMLLHDLNPDFISMMDGARHAISSDNPDRVRHFTVSYRELFTHVLHTLAPDDAIRAWSSAKEHYSNNRPTRKARLLYVCRNVNQMPFDEFVTKDIEATLAALNLFQQGTHQVTSAFTATQIAALQARIEGVLRFLLEIYKADGEH